MAGDDDLTFGRDGCCRHRTSYLIGKTEVGTGAAGRRIERFRRVSADELPNSCRLLGPTPRICNSVSTSAVTTCSTEPSWFNSRVASAGPTPGSPWSMKMHRDARRFG